MGRFSNMIKSAADKGRSVVKKRNTSEPAQIPSFAVSDLNRKKMIIRVMN